MKLCTKQEMLRKIEKSEWIYMKKRISFWETLITF